MDIQSFVGKKVYLEMQGKVKGVIHLGPEQLKTTIIEAMVIKIENGFLVGETPPVGDMAYHPKTIWNSIRVPLTWIVGIEDYNQLLIDKRCYIPKGGC